MTSLAVPRHMARRLSAVSTPELAQYQWIIQPVVVFLFARILLSVVTYFAEIAIPGLDGPGLWHIDPANVWLDVWARWDSGFYVDIVENEKNYEISVELPGFDKDAVSLKVEDHVLTLSGERKMADEDEGRNWRRVERLYGNFERKFRLPREVETDQIEAQMVNGLLTITIAKSDKVTGREIKVK